MPIAVVIDVMLARRKMSVGELAERVGITPANLAVLKNGRAKAVRLPTLAALCEVLECQPGDLLRWEAENAGSDDVLQGGHENAWHQRPVARHLDRMDVDRRSPAGDVQ
jgi:putative transcriptional regulator